MPFLRVKDLYFLSVAGQFSLPVGFVQLFDNNLYCLTATFRQ